MVESIIAIPMSIDKNSPHVMHDKPRKVKESIFKGILVQTLFSAIVVSGSVVAAYFVGEAGVGHDQAQAMAFLVLASAPMFTALVIRYERLVLLTKRMWSNKYLLAAIVFGLGMNFLAIYTPLSIVAKLTAID